MDVDEIVKMVCRYKSYFAEKGGITLSGGEPLMQLDFCIELLRKCKEQGIHTAIDTSGACFTSSQKEKYEQLLSVCDLFLLDVKHMHPQKHQKLTGKGNENPLAFAKFLSERRHPVWIRYVPVPGYTDSEEDLLSLRALLKDLQNVEKVEVLPYHTLGIQKYEKLGKSYPLKGVEPPKKDDVERAKRILGLKRANE